MSLPIDPQSSVPLVLTDDAELGRADLQDCSFQVARRLRRKTVQRVLIISDDPFRILTAIDACHQVSADLWIAHTNMESDVIEEVSGGCGIQMTLTDAGEQSNLGASGKPSSGQVRLMTSGTTGRPKIVAHTLESLVARIQATAKLPGGQHNRWLLTYQATAFAGLQVILTAALSGGCLVVTKQRSPADFFGAAERHGVTHISGTPTFWRSFLLVAPPGSLSELRQITMGGEAVDQPTLDRLRAAFPNAHITHIYASTEAGVVFSVHDGEEGFPAEWLEGVVQGVKLRVSEGMLEVKTSRGMLGYSDLAAPLTDDGWLRTGDLVEISRGRVRFMGRQDSIINVGGAKVYPQVVESFLLSLPGVREARVRGISNPISGFLVGAEIVLDTAEADRESRETIRQRILQQCRKFLPGYQVPRILRIVNSIPVHESGKKA